MDDAGREALLKAFDRAWGAKDVEALMELMAADPTFRASVGPEPGSTFRGREEVRRGFGLFLGAATGPPPETDGPEIRVGGDFAVTRWTLRIPQGEGAPVVVHGCDVFEFEGDRISLKDTYRKVTGDLPPGPSQEPR